MDEPNPYIAPQTTKISQSLLGDVETLAMLFSYSGEPFPATINFEGRFDPKEYQAEFLAVYKVMAALIQPKQKPPAIPKATIQFLIFTSLTLAIIGLLLYLIDARLSRTTIIYIISGAILFAVFVRAVVRRIKQFNAEKPNIIRGQLEATGIRYFPLAKSELKIWWLFRWSNRERFFRWADIQPIELESNALIVTKEQKRIVFLNSVAQYEEQFNSSIFHVIGLQQSYFENEVHWSTLLDFVARVYAKVPPPQTTT